MANERFPAVFEQFLQQAKELRKEFKGWEDFETLAENEREARRILHAAKKSGDGMSRDSHRRRST
jgi:hypothetical protein